MKKILFILLTFYSFSYASTNYTATEFANALSNLTCSIDNITSPYGSTTSEISLAQSNTTITTYSRNNYNGVDYYTIGTTKYYMEVVNNETQSYTNYLQKGSSRTYYNCVTSSSQQLEQGKDGMCQGDSIITLGDDTFQCSEIYDTLTLLPPVDNGSYNPDGTMTCNTGFQDVNGSCISSPENGYFDPDGNIACNSPYIQVGGYCVLPDGTNENGTCQTGFYKKLSLDGGSTCVPNVTNNPDGSTTTVADDGVSQTTDYQGGTTVATDNNTGVTTTSNDGAVIETNSEGVAVSTGGTDSVHSSNTNGGTGGGNEDTSQEQNTDDTVNDLPNASVDSNCNDVNLTLQEKLLCELNEGMKKQNSEDDPTNSLNNLFKDLRDNQQTDNTAMNNNLKDIESLNKDIKLTNLMQLTTLNSTKTAIVSSAGSLSSIDKIMNDLIGSVPDTTVDNPINTIDTDSDGFYTQFTTFVVTQKESYDNLKILVDDTTTLINEGFHFNNISKSNVQSCPLKFTLDFSELNQSDIEIDLDICEFTSMTRVFLYPFFFIILTLAVIYFSISVIRSF